MAAPQHLPTPGLPAGSPMSPRGRPPSTPSSARYRNPHYPGSPGMPPLGMAQRPYGSLASSSNLGRHPSRPSVRGADMAALPMSPDAKRRRYDSAVGPPPPGALYGPQRPSLPRPEFLPRPPFHMANPPPRSQPGPISSRDDGRSAGGSGGPTLAPLHTAGSVSSSRDGNGSDAQAQSVAAMIQSIAPLNKIRLLAKISRPLASPGPMSPPHPIRGALVAIEGNDDVALDAVAQHLTDALERDGDFRVRVFAQPDWMPPKSGLSNADCLALIQKYHAQSAEIASFITSLGDAAPAASDSAPAAPSDPSDAARESESPVSPKTVKPQPPAKSTRSHSNGAEPNANAGPNADAMDVDTAPTAHAPPKPAPLPVALVPRYQLTLTDAAAAAAAIADEYSPTDHWQWVATLWRGTVGPDVTVDVRAPAPDSAEGGATAPDGRGAGGGAQAVDVKLAEARAVLIRGEGKGRVSESGLRRVGFEVGEWLRSKGERAGG